MVAEKVVLLLLLLINGVFAMISSKDMEGYAEGFLGNCPHTDWPAVLKQKTKRTISLIVLGEEGETNYNYFQASELVKDPGFDFSKRTVLYVGGFLDSPKHIEAQAIGRFYKTLGYNVMLFQADKFMIVHYPIAARMIRPIGHAIAEMLTNLTAHHMDLRKFEVIGISLGGQISSFIAKSYYQLTGNKIPRIVALDPAGPCFRNNDANNRLDDSDADFVVTINTNIDGYGMAAPVGHVNFYVNGGEYQPGDIYYLPCTIMCSHTRAYFIWLVSIGNPDAFIGIKCDSVQEARRHECFGKDPLITHTLSPDRVNASNPGIFYLATNTTWPYYLGKKGLTRDGDVYKTKVLDFNSEEVMRI
ncbi:phospholipase A1 [Plutella xylostella]|uniref:phospholipase A1 n=1 Tax=Plutella xylostella TaxID=51655 RepID=UPI0020322A66|nr:phospholipase A1 [Plutella xylostella]